ncbi:MAG: DUF1491 family protein [Pseudomonadota bacterium]
MIRLTTDLWLAAYRRKLEAAGIHAHVVHRGNETAGDVIVKVATMDGRAGLWERGWDETGNPGWVQTLGPVPEGEAEETVSRRRGRDRDLWVIEIEDPRGRHLLEDDAFRG